MQAKFINLFGQWVHPDFLKLVPAGESCQLYFKNIGDVIHDQFNQPIMSSSIFFQGKTIDEVAEEYNRQVDIQNSYALSKYCTIMENKP
jgi:hypothetical protein